MPIPLTPGASTARARQIARLQRQQSSAVRDIRRLLCKARIHAILADNGNEDSRDEMQTYLDLAIEAGLSPQSIRAGGGMAAKISNLIDRPESQAHTMGLLLAAADMAGDYDPSLAASIAQLANTIESTAEAQRWQTLTVPRVFSPSPRS